MDQKELNRIAMNFIRTQSIEVATKLRETLSGDIEERSEQVSGQALHYIHNMALFDCMIWLNSLIALNDIPEEAIDEYLIFAESLRSKFMAIVNELKDFQPTE